MGGISKRTFRISGLNAAVSKEELDRIVRELNGHDERYKDCLPRTSLAFLPDIDGHDSRKCSTVSGRSKRHKKNLLDRVDEYSEWPAADPTPTPLCKDTFGGMTVLHSPENANLDICFVHGLNGHAIDTFEKRVESNGPRTARARRQPYHLWPMDLLDREHLQASRVLSFDYDSGLHDKNNTSGIEQWSSDILDSLHRIRSACSDRPIIFVGYSLGGIVARQAAADLWKRRDDQEFLHVPLRRCGFIFLGTPHRGSVQANNSRVTLLVLDFMGYRTEILQLFNYFNRNLKENRQMWRQFQKNVDIGERPIVCFSEARKSKFLRGFLKRVVVDREEAEWMNGIVEEIPGSDHHSICAYSSAYDPGLGKILSRLVWMKGQLGVQDQNGQSFTQDHRHHETSHGNDGGDPLAVTASVADATPQSVSGIPSDLGNAAQDLSNPDSGQCSGTVLQPGQELCTKKRAPTRTDSDQCHMVSSVSTYRSPGHVVSSNEKPKVELNAVSNTNRTHNDLNVRCLLTVSVQSDMGNPSTSTPEEGHKQHACGSNKMQTSQQVPRSSFPSSSDSDARPSDFTKAEECPLDSRPPSQLSLLDDRLSAASHVNQDEAWKKQSVLCLDGGGLRGYSSLLILRELMSRIRDIERQSDEWRTDDRPWKERISQPSSQTSAVSARMSRMFSRPNASSKNAKRDEKRNWDELYLPCHYFDYIFGTGTGGIIAIMLGRLRMSIKDCVQRYRWFAREFFEIPLQPLLTSCFKTQDRSHEWEVRLKELVNNHAGTDQDLGFKSPQDLCKTCVMSFDVESERVKAFRTYDQANKRATGTQPSRFEPISPGTADDCEIWQAARATSSAPSHFKPVKINGSKYLDGGIKINNPARESINEVAHMLGGDPSTISSLTSIGCGSPKELKQNVRGFKMLKAKNSLKAATIDSNTVHEDVEFRAAMLGIPYFRFEVEGQTWKHPLMEGHPDSVYEDFERELIAHFQNNEKASQQLHDCAVDLVKQRYLRAKDTDRWRRFTHATFFRCSHDGKEFSLRGRFRKHLEHHHPEWTEMSISQQESYIDSCEERPFIPGGPQ